MGTMFQQATRRKLKLRMALCSPAGYGKSYTGLIFAQALAKIFKTKVAAIDTEHGALSKYQGTVGKDFAVCELQHFAPSAYTAAIRAAALDGYGVLLIDSLSHAWSGVGGALAQVDAKAAGGGNSYVAWKDVTPQHNELVEAILAYPGHVIATMRTKMEYVLEEEVNRQGKKTMVPKKVGMKPVQREGMDYEFDVVCDLDESHTLIVGKTRCPAIDGQRVVKPGPDFLTPVVAWLDEGEGSQPANPTFQPAVSTQAAPSPTASTSAPETTVLQSATMTAKATLEQQTEIALIINTCQVEGQPQRLLASRKITTLADLDQADAETILSKLRPKLEAHRAAQALDASRADGGGTVVSPVPEPTFPANPDRVGTIDEEDRKKILAGVKKLQISDEDLKRVLGKLKTQAGDVVHSVPDLSYNQGKRLLENIVKRIQKDFGDCPF